MKQKEGLVVLLVLGLAVSLYFNYTQSNTNKQLNVAIEQDTALLVQAQKEYTLLTNSYKTLRNDYELLETSARNEYQLLEASTQNIECEITGARRGILLCTGHEWIRCYTSLEDINGADKNSQCCMASQGTWHEGRCCASGKITGNWIGEYGKCWDGAWLLGEFHN